MRAKVIAYGIIAPNAPGKKPKPVIIMIENPAKSFNKICPANMFAHNRTDKLIGLETNDIISKIDTKGNIAIGIPEGQNNFRNLKPLLKTPYPITKLITIIASVNVTIMWLVVVKKNGIIPSKFAKSININKVF